MPRTLRLPAALVALALGAWIATALLMRGMASMDGPGPLGSFLWLWIAMTAAMMLPSVVPAASLAASVGRSGGVFVTGYLGSRTELINDEVVVHDPPFEFELRGTCAFRREFDYWG